jgi:hypothetical protein
MRQEIRISERVGPRLGGGCATPPLPDTLHRRAGAQRPLSAIRGGWAGYRALRVVVSGAEARGNPTAQPRHKHLSAHPPATRRPGARETHASLLGPARSSRPGHGVLRLQDPRRLSLSSYPSGHGVFADAPMARISPCRRRPAGEARSGPDAISLGRRPALLIARYFCYAARSSPVTGGAVCRVSSQAGVSDSAARALASPWKADVIRHPVEWQPSTYSAVERIGARPDAPRRSPPQDLAVRRALPRRW